MATQVQFRRGTTSQMASFTGAIGEVVVDTQKYVPVVHDGTTPGGFPAMRQDGTNMLLSSGSLGSPALKFATSTNTGLYSPSTGAVTLVSGGVATISVDPFGSVTIPGNVTVSGNLTVAGSFSSSDALALIVALG